MDRRDFVKASTLAAIGLGVAPMEIACKGADGSRAASTTGDRTASKDITDNQAATSRTPDGNEAESRQASTKTRTTRVEYKEADAADIIIAGGGPAGIGAAITAAKMGKKVILLEGGHCLGGIWTRSLLTCVIDFGRADVAKDIIKRLDARGARTPRRYEMLDKNFLFEPEVMKIVLEEMCDEAGVRYIYNCPVVGVEKDGRRIKAVFTESKSGRQRWTAKAFFDTTGDGELAVKAGCGYDFGGDNPGDNDQPASLLSLVTIEDDTRVAEFITNDHMNLTPDGKTLNSPKDRFREYVHQTNKEPAAPVLARIRKNLLALSTGFEYGVRVDDAEGITRATVHARREIFTVVESLLAQDPERWKGLRIVSVSDHLGQRASRRIHGLYTITNEDIASGARFDDAVAWSNSSIDVHATKKGEAYNVFPDFRSKPFQIPFRACQAKDVDNLYMAGKCISGGFYPMASYRMTGNAVEMGENVARRVCETL